MTQKEALKYVYSQRQGLMSDLRDKVDHEMILGFELTGIIQKGQESSRKNSWKLTGEGEKIYKFAYFEEEYKPSFFDKLQTFTHGLFIDKKLFATN